MYRKVILCSSSSMMKKLKKSFLNSRLHKLEKVPLSWGLKAQQASQGLYLDIRLCQLLDIGKQLICLFTSTRSSSLVSSAASSIARQGDESNPDFIFSADFSYNELSALTYSDLSAFEEIRSLTASFNQIKVIHGIASCPHLTNICLSYNCIEKLPSRALSELKKLTHLVSLR